MKITVELDPAAALFYTRAAALCGRSLSEILSDALFILAGKLSQDALESAREKNHSETPL